MSWVKFWRIELIKPEGVNMWYLPVIHPGDSRWTHSRPPLWKVIEWWSFHVSLLNMERAWYKPSSLCRKQEVLKLMGPTCENMLRLLIKLIPTLAKYVHESQFWSHLDICMVTKIRFQIPQQRPLLNRTIQNECNKTCSSFYWREQTPEFVFDTPLDYVL